MLNKKTFRDLQIGNALEAAKRWKQREPVRKGTGMIKGISQEEVDIADKRVNTHFTREALRKKPGTDLNKPLVFPERIIKGNDLKEFAPTEMARKSGIPVARIENIPGKGMQPEGFATGFLVSPNLLLTNNHVFPDANAAIDCAANFLYERNMAGINSGFRFVIDPSRFFLTNVDLDFSLVYVESLSMENNFSIAGFNYLRMIDTPGKILVGQPINIIQHPAGGIKNYAYQNNNVVDILNLEQYIQYSTDTKEGSSGSPCFNNSWELVALHHSGVPLIIDGKIINTQGQFWDKENQDQDEIQWIANEGISISKIVLGLKASNMGDASKQALLNNLIQTTADPLLNGSAERTTNKEIVNSPITHIKDSAMPSVNMNFSGPVTINIGDAFSNAGLSAPFVGTGLNLGDKPSFAEKKQNFDTDYDSRPGFDTGFLAGYTFDLPEVISSRQDEMFLSFSDNKPYVLKYHHYSLVMNKKRRLCMWTASNVDFNAEKRSTRDRTEFGSEDWTVDPRIPAKYQITDEEFYKPAKLIDRGHIVRRADNCWGDTELEIEYANADTYHWTNCCQQHQSFNRDKFGEHGIWGMLENTIESQLNLADGRAIIYAGPVLDNETDPVATIDQKDIQYPLKFWKVVVAIDELEGLISYGFILDQSDVINDQGIGLEKLDFGKFKSQQETIHSITSLTGVKFPDRVYDADVLTGSGIDIDGSRPFVNVNEMILRRNKGNGKSK